MHAPPIQTSGCGRGAKSPTVLPADLETRQRRCGPHKSRAQKHVNHHCMLRPALRICYLSRAGNGRMVRRVCPQPLAACEHRYFRTLWSRPAGATATSSAGLKSTGMEAWHERHAAKPWPNHPADGLGKPPSTSLASLHCITRPSKCFSVNQQGTATSNLKRYANERKSSNELRCNSCERTE